MEWMEELRRILSKIPEDGEIVFLGVGNPLRGDDGIGVKITRDLKALLERRGNRKRIKPIIVEDRVDLIPKFLRGLNPDLIIVFDAMDFGGEIGEIRFVSLPEADETISTHNIPLDLTLKLAGITAPAYVLGIQISSTEFGKPINPRVLKASEEVIRFLSEELIG